MEKYSKIDKSDLLKQLSDLLNFFSDSEKVFGLLAKNYLQYFLKELTEKEILNNEKIKSEICLEVKSMKIIKDHLTKDKNFFNKYGLYSENYDTIDDFLQKLNNIWEKINGFRYEGFRFRITKKIAGSLDKEIENARKKAQKILIQSEDYFKNELNYIFWLQNAEPKSKKISGKNFLANLQNIVKIFELKLDDLYECKFLDKMKKSEYTMKEIADFFAVEFTNFTNYLVKEKEEIKQNISPIHQFLSNERFSFNNIPITCSRKVYDCLCLRVIEVIPTAPTTDVFKLNSLIKMSSKTYQIDKDEYNLKNPGELYFGKTSPTGTAEIAFGAGIKELSRSHFKITTGGKKDDDYKLECTSKNEIFFKIFQFPFPLENKNMLTLSPTETLLLIIEDNLNAKKEVEDEDDDEDATELVIFKKKASFPYVILYGIHDVKNSESLKKAKKIEFVDYKSYKVSDGEIQNGEFIKEKEVEIFENFKFGEHWVFKDQKANNQSEIYFEKNEGWYIKSLSFKDPRSKQFSTLISLLHYDRSIAEKNPRTKILQENMVIHLCGYSFLIEGEPKNGHF